MPTLANNANVTLNLTDFDSVTISTLGVATVAAVSGLGVAAGKIGEFTGSRTLGPFTAGSLSIAASVRDCLYEVADGVRPVEQSGAGAVAAITGSYVVGQTLTATFPAGITGTIQFTRTLAAAPFTKTAISGAVASAVGSLTYTVQSADTGYVLGVDCTTVQAGVGGVVQTASGVFRWVNATTRTITNNSYFSSLKQVMSSTLHSSPVALTSLKLVDSNWNWSAGSESAGAGANTITWSVEYPLGTTPQVVKTAGSTVATNPSGQDLESDELVLTTAIPANTPFRVRKYTTNPSGLYIYQTQSSGDSCIFGGSGVADQTTTTGFTGTSSDSVSTSYPSAILGYLSGVSVGVVGDSRIVGVNDLTPPVKWAKGEVGRAIAANYPLIQFGSSGETQAQFSAAAAARRIAFIGKYCTHVVCEHAVNSFSTSALAITRARVIWNMFKDLGLKVFQTTTPPRTTGAWTATDGSDQTVDSTSAEMIVWNTYLLGGQTEVGAIDVASAISLVADPKKWKAPGFTTDGLHESTAAITAFVNSGTITSTTFQ